MTRKVYNIIQSNVYQDFKCIGGKCEDSCCIGWTVDIDEKTYNFLKNIKKHDLSNRIKNKIYENEYCYSNDVDYCNVVLNKKRECAFLNSSKLCDLQISFGEEGISNVCNLYPRTLNKINGKYERSLAMSCPEAARKVLLNKSGIEYALTKDKLPHLILETVADTNDNNHKNTAVAYLIELRAFSVWIVKRSEYTLAERLILLGEFQRELEVLIDNNKCNDINSLIEKWKKKVIAKVELKIEEKDIKDSKKLLLDIQGMLNIETEVDNERFKEFYRLFDKSHKSHEKISEINDFYISNSYIFENYIINDMFRNLYPFSEPGTPLDSYKMLVTRFSLIKLYLSGISQSLGNITEDNVVDFIQAFSKTVEHHHTYLERISDTLLSSKMINIEYSI